MHKWVYEKAECLKNELCANGMNLTHEQLEEAYYYSKILKNMVCIDKEVKIVEAMEKSENEDEIMEKIEQYTDYPEKRFYNSNRYANGRYAPKGRGMRRYTEPMMMYEDYDMEDAERMRDMDRKGMGKMYYTSGSENGNMRSQMSSQNSNSMRDMREGKSGRNRVRYFESKEMHKANTPEDKQAKMHELEEYAKELSSDVVEMIEDATPEERTMLKNKITMLANRI